MYTPSSKKVLATAVLCSLLTTSPVWAAQQATTTVTTDTNVSKADDPYSKIEVKSTDAGALGIAVADYNSANLHVYMSTDGVINVSAAPTAKNTYADVTGIQNVRRAASQSDTTLTVTGPATLTVSATGGENTGGNSATGNAWGIDLSSASRTSLETVNATVTATGGKVTGVVLADRYLATEATACGVQVEVANLTTGAASFTVTAQGGTVSGSASSAKASAYGVKAWGGTTAIGGDLALTIKSAGGTVAENGELAVAYADAYGVRISPYMNPGATYPGSLTVNGAITGSITAQGGTAKLASPDNSYNGGNLCKATGIDNDSSTLQADGASLTVTAAGGAFTSSLAEYVSASAEAYGIATSGAHTTSITGATKLTVTATGGTATTKTDAADDSGSAYASAEAYGVGNSYNLYAQTSSGLTVSTLTLGSLAAEVTATAGNAQDIGQPGKNSSAYATAFGISNGTNTTVQNTNPTATIKAASADLTVTAAGGTGADASAAATGIYNSASGGTAATAITGLAKTTVTAAGGNNSTDQSWAYAIGIGNSAYEATKNDSKHTHLAYGTATFQAGSVESTVTATGGSSSAANGIGNVNAFGVTNYGYDENKATLTVTGPSTVAATATANAATPSYVEAIGLGNNGDTSAVMSLQDATVTATATGGNTGFEGNITNTAQAIQNYFGVVTARNLNLTATATGGAKPAGSDKVRQTEAHGIYNYAGTVSATGAVTIKTSVTPGGGANEYFAADSLYADGGGTINVGTDGATATGATVQLEGDVQAINNGTVNLTLATADSYLQGNVQTMTHKTIDGSPDGDAGTVNLTVTNGATWRPVYDNRYGSRNTADETYNYDEDGNYLNTTYNYNIPAQSATFADNSIGTLALSNGGIVDLTWDNTTRDAATAGRTLTITELNGDGGVFKINSNLAQNKADEITLGENSTSTSVGVDVAYDPALTASTLTKGSSVTGKALVLTDKSGNLTSVQGVADFYNIYNYTPTITMGTDGQWYLTGLTIDKVTPQGPASGAVRSAGQDRLALNDLFLVESNSLAKRMGELRDYAADVLTDAKTAGTDVSADRAAGVWARYQNGKLEQGDASMKSNLFQAGYDVAKTGKSEKTYRGLALSYAKGDGSYELGSGDVKETTFSLYQTGIKNDGRYYDVVLKAGKYMNDYDITATANPSSADYSTWAYSISGEVGKRIQLGGGLYVEPQAELILGRLNGADYTTSTGMNVSLDAQNKAITRLGLAFGKSYSRGSLYGKASYYHDFGSGVDLTAAYGGGSVGYSEDMARNWTELTIGGSAKMGKNANAYAEVSKYLGQLSSNVRFNIGARWSF
jgi:outer membrane autotransporter protein